jgi:hypothetical protein
MKAAVTAITIVPHVPFPMIIRETFLWFSSNSWTRWTKLQKPKAKVGSTWHVSHDLKEIKERGQLQCIRLVKSDIVLGLLPLFAELGSHVRRKASICTDQFGLDIPVINRTENATLFIVKWARFPSEHLPLPFLRSIDGGKTNIWGGPRATKLNQHKIRGYLLEIASADRFCAVFPEYVQTRFKTGID